MAAMAAVLMLAATAWPQMYMFSLAGMLHDKDCAADAPMHILLSFDDRAHLEAVHRAHVDADVPPDRRPDGQALGRAHVLAAAERVADVQADGRADGATLWVAHRRPDDRADL